MQKFVEAVQMRQNFSAPPDLAREIFPPINEPNNIPKGPPNEKPTIPPIKLPQIDIKN